MSGKERLSVTVDPDLLAAAADVVDAAVVLLADDGDLVLTSDVSDLRALAQAAGTHLELIPV